MRVEPTCPPPPFLTFLLFTLGKTLLDESDVEIYFMMGHVCIIYLYL